MLGRGSQNPKAVPNCCSGEDGPLLDKTPGRAESAGDRDWVQVFQATPLLLYGVAGECGLHVLKGMGGRATGALVAGPFPVDLFVGHCFFIFRLPRV